MLGKALGQGRNQDAGINLGCHLGQYPYSGNALVLRSYLPLKHPYIWRSRRGRVLTPTP